MTFSNMQECPKCHKESLCVNANTREPFTDGECYECGYYFFPKEGQYTLEELNYVRRDNYEKEPVKELPKIELD